MGERDDALATLGGYIADAEEGRADPDVVVLTLAEAVRIRDEIVALRDDVEMYKRMAIDAMDKAQNDAVAAARTAALGDAVRVCRDYHRRLLDLHKSHHHGYVVACNECANAILALKDQRHE